MTKKIFLILLLMSVVKITGCSEANNFEGKWITIVKNDWDGTKQLVKLDISRNGDNFLIAQTLERYKDVGRTVGEAGKTAAWQASEVKTRSAVLKEGKLILDPFTSLTFVKSEGTLLGPRGEVYKKETSELFNQLKAEATSSFKSRYPQMTLQQ